MPKSSAAPATPTRSPDPLARIHNVTPNAMPLFASIVFTPATTFDQAVAIIGGDPYPWTCDEPRSPVAPSLAEQRAAFATAHWLLISYPQWNQLMRIAAAPQVVSVEAAPLYPCP